MRKVLVYLAHPRLDRSEVHARLIPMVIEHPTTSFVDLYAEYPDLVIDVKKEQDRLVEHDVILFQHPVYWYSTPSIMKEWQDLVLEYGFAYGSKGQALHGKAFGQVVSAGAHEKDYSRSGANQMTMTEMFNPIKAMARLCGMTYLPPLAIFSAIYKGNEDAVEEFTRAYELYLDGLGDRSKPIKEFQKHDDLLSAFRAFMRL